MYLGAPMLCAYIFTVVISWVDPFMIMQVPFLSLVTIFALKSTLCGINKVTSFLKS